MPKRATPADTQKNGDHSCRWPVAGTHGLNYVWCGKEAVRLRSYCPHHLCQAYQSLAVAQGRIVSATQSYRSFLQKHWETLLA